MAYTIEGTQITLVRGDSLSLTVGIENEDGSAYTPAAGDSIRFALKRARMNQAGTEYSDAEPLIEKTIPNDTLILSLEPDDTKSLGFGTYDYDIELTKENGEVDTFIKASPFVLAKEVH